MPMQDPCQLFAGKNRANPDGAVMRLILIRIAQSTPHVNLEVK